MELSLVEAAAQLGKTPRQVRYLIKQGRLRARKHGTSWLIDSADLPKSEAQAEAALAQQTQLRAAVEEALELPRGERRRGYSFTQLRASQIALPLYRTASTTLGSEHPATRALHAVIEQLARGCHRFGRPEKSEAYRAARDEASRAACSLAVASEASATPLLETVEHELMAALVGAASGRSRRHGRWVQRRPRA